MMETDTMKTDIALINQKLESISDSIASMKISLDKTAEQNRIDHKEFYDRIEKNALEVSNIKTGLENTYKWIIALGSGVAFGILKLFRGGN